MEDQYGMADLRQYISSRPLFPPIPPPPDLLSAHRGLAPHNPYDMLLFRSDSNTSTAPSVTTVNNNTIGAAASSSGAAGGGFSGFEMDAGGMSGGGGGVGGDGGAGRWPRQETLTLLEIRSRLDPKFKEANQKGPLWDEVSRIMCEEHGYQRSGKKCREKFENLYKYYKKTKEGKAGRQDGKHYRFFRQLEALYGETSSNTNNNNSASVSAAETHPLSGGNFHYNFPNKNASSSLPNINNQESYLGTKLSDTCLSLSNYSESDTTSSDDSDLNEGILLDNTTDSKKKRRGKKKNWKLKIKDFIDAQMKKLMDKQEIWMEKMMRTIEHKEQERILREEEWRKQDLARMEKEHKFWAGERAWIEARDASLMDSLHKITGKGVMMRGCNSPAEELLMVSDQNQQNDDGSDQTIVKGSSEMMWGESEITRLIQLRAGMEVKFQQGGISEESMWDEISNRMGCFGNERRSGLMCKDKWYSVNNYLLKCSNNNKKRKENSKSCSTTNYYQNHIGGGYCDINSHEQGVVDHTISLNHHPGNSPNSTPTPNNNNNNNNNAGNGLASENCFRYFMGDGYGRLMD